MLGPLAAIFGARAPEPAGDSFSRHRGSRAGASSWPVDERVALRPIRHNYAMRSVSPPVVAVAAEVARVAINEGGLKLLFIEAGLGAFVPKKFYGKTQLVAATVESALDKAARGDRVVGDALDTFVSKVAAQVGGRDNAEDEGTPFWRLREALRADGLDLRRVVEDSDPQAWPPRPPRIVSVRILPLEDPREPLSELISALEEDLQRLGFDVAANCYRQAVDAIVDQRYESTNAQMRALFEEVAIQAAVARGFTRRRQGEGGKAIKFLIDQGDLTPDDGGTFIQGLWSMTHTNGSHPGMTTAGEARFRLHAITSAVRFMTDQFLLTSRL